MARGINIEFLADVRRFLSGTKDVESALDDVASSLDDVAKDAAKAGDKVGKELESGAKEAGDAGDKLERKFRDAFDAVRKDSRKAGDDVGDETRKGFSRAEEAAEGFKDEARQNFAETASSFDGSMDSIADMAQSTLGGLATAIPGAGIALAGLGAAAGVFYAQWKENAEKTEARISSMYDDMLESGNRFLSAQYVNQGISEILNNDENAVINYARAQEIAARTGIELTTVVRAYAGDADAAAVVSEELTRRQEELADQNSSSNYVFGSMAEQLDRVTGATATAAEKADVYSESMLVSQEAAREYAIAQAGVDASVSSAREAMEENTEAFAGNADQIREQNLGVLAELAGDLDGVNRSAAAAGVTGAALTAVQQRQYDAFLKAATGAGITEDAARDLARQYGLVPATVQTQVSAPGADAAADAVDRLRDSIAKLPKYAPADIPGSEAWLAARGIKRASGGYVHGPGGGLDDRIPASLSAGEYVLDAATVQRIGPGRLDQINNGQPQASRRAGAGGGGLTVNIGQLHAQNPKQAAAMVESRLRDAIATFGIGGLRP